MDYVKVCISLENICSYSVSVISDHCNKHFQFRRCIVTSWLTCYSTLSLTVYFTKCNCLFHWPSRFARQSRILFCNLLHHFHNVSELNVTSIAGLCSLAKWGNFFLWMLVFSSVIGLFFAGSKWSWRSQATKSSILRWTWYLVYCRFLEDEFQTICNLESG